MKFLLKTIFLLAILVLLVIIGMNNHQKVELALPPLLAKPQRLPAALMYSAFFAIGLLSGAILNAGKKGGGSAS